MVEALTRWQHHLAFVITVAGCGTPSDGGSGLADACDAGDESPCSRPGDPYLAGLTRTSRNGVFTVELLEADPAPPAMGENMWQLRLTDEAAHPIIEATLVATSFMPDHAHSGPSIDVSELGKGEYQATMNIVLMSGLYSFRFRVGDEQDNSATYEFCVR